MARTPGKPNVSGEATAAVEGTFEDEDHSLARVPHQGMVATRTAYQAAMVVQKPRDPKAALAAATREAALAGKDFLYSWVVKSKNGPEVIEGTSIDGAMVMLRNWGNAVVPVDIVEDAPAHWVFKATFIDLETGVNVERLFRQRKSQSTGKMDADRALDIAFQIGQSKAQRNVIVKALPVWFHNQCVDAAKEAAESKFKDVPGEAKKAIASFQKGGIELDALEWYVGAALAQWTPADLVRLQGLFNALRDRVAVKDEVFGSFYETKNAATAAAATAPTPPASEPKTSTATSPSPQEGSDKSPPPPAKDP